MVTFLDPEEFAERFWADPDGAMEWLAANIEALPGRGDQLFVQMAMMIALVAKWIRKILIEDDPDEVRRRLARLSITLDEALDNYRRDAEEVLGVQMKRVDG